MTDPLEEAKRLSEAATPGPWEFSDSSDVRGHKGEFRAPDPFNGFMLVGPWTNWHDYELMARARTLIPELVERAKQAERLLTAHREEFMGDKEFGSRAEALECLQDFEREHALAAQQREVEGA